MFTLNKAQFAEGKPLALVTAYKDERFRPIKDNGCYYLFSPLGEVSSTVYAFRVTRAVCTFTDSYPSFPEKRVSLTRVWERADVSLSVKGTLTDHLIGIVQELDKDYNDHNPCEAMQVAPWYAMMHAPEVKPHFYQGTHVMQVQA